MRSAPTLTWDFASCKSSIDVFLAVAPHLGTRTGAAAMHVVSVRRSWCGWVKPMSDAWAAVSWNARTPILERVRAESGMRLAQNHWSEHCARAAQHNEDWLGFAWPGPRLRPPPEPLRRRRPTRITRIQPHAKRHLDARVHAQTSPTRKAQIRRADGCVWNEGKTGPLCSAYAILGVASRSCPAEDMLCMAEPLGIKESRCT